MPISSTPARAPSARTPRRRAAVVATLVALHLMFAAGAGAQGGPPEIVALTLNPTQVLGGATVTATVVLDKAASSNGFEVTLGITPGSAQLAATTLQIPAGQSSGTVNVSTVPTATTQVATLTATARNRTVTATLTISAPTILSLTLARTSIETRQSTTGTLTMDGVAPAAGMTVTLASSSSAVTVPASAIVQAGQSSATFVVTAGNSLPPGGTATITATSGSASRTATLTVTLPPAVPKVADLRLTPSTIVSGTQSTGRVTIDVPAPASGTIVTLTKNRDFVRMPATVVVPAGQTAADFTITSFRPAGADPGIGGVFITADAGGMSRTVSLTVTGIPLELEIYHSWKSGVTGTFRVRSHVVPSGGGPVSFMISGLSVPADFFPPVTLTTNGSSETVTLTAMPRTSEDRNFVLTATAFGHTVSIGHVLLAPRLRSQEPIDSVVAGSTFPKRFLLDAIPPYASPGVTFSSSSPVLSLASSSPTVARDTVTFMLRAAAVNTRTPVVVSGARLGVTMSDTIWVLPGRTYMSQFALSHASASPGGSVMAGVELNAPAPAGGAVVALSVTSPLAAALNLPAQLVVPAGARSATVSVGVKSGASPTSGTITATLGTQRLTAKLDVK